MAGVTITPGSKAYRPYGAALDLFACRDQEVLLSGPAGTGKSRACLEKLHLAAEKYPGMRGLILRKTRESLSQSALVTFERNVVPEGHPILKGPQRNMRQSYRYPNGSEIVVGGLDKSEKVMSTEYDMAYIQEAIEVGVKDWENVSTRLRNGRMPYQQIMADTNPDAPTHWLYRRCLEGKTTFFESRHEDNPVLFDQNQGTWTPAGVTYISRLDNLSGTRLQRLRYGKWVAAEGLVYDGWDRSIHMCDRFVPPYEWSRFWTVDFGFTNPFVWQNWVLHPDDIMILYQEIYITQKLVEDICPMIVDAAKRQPSPRAIICDHDAEGRATLVKHLNMSTKPALKAVELGIQGVAARLKLRANGEPGLKIMHDARVHPPDPELDEAKKPLCTAEEMDGYIWDIKAGQKKGDVPVKENDHGCDAKRYGVAFHDRLGGGGARLVRPTIHVPTQEEELKAINAIGYQNMLNRIHGRGRYQR